MTDERALRREAITYSRYLIGAEPSTELITRYGHALAARLPESPDRVMRATLAMPVLLGPLDAGAALIRPHHQLRQRLLLLTAILEASPDHCRAFLPRDHTGWETLRLAITLAVALPLGALVGVPLFMLLDRGATTSV